jgi:hypothetical protein
LSKFLFVDGAEFRLDEDKKLSTNSRELILVRASLSAVVTDFSAAAVGSSTALPSPSIDFA